MVSIAVISPNQDKRLAFATRLTDSLKGMRFPCRICSVKDPFASADKDPLEGFGILCLDAEDPDFARRALLGPREPPPEVILLDAHSNTVLSLLRFKPAAALQTCDDAEKLCSAILVCAAWLGRRARFFRVQTKTKSLRIPYDNLLYFESRQRRVIIHTLDASDGTSFSATLDSVEASVPGSLFIRCHQSFLVRTDAVCEIDRTARSLVLSNGQTVGISDRYWHAVTEALKEASS